MAYSIEIKNKVKKKLQEGKTAREISEEMNISIATIYNWKKTLIQESKEKYIDKDYTKNDIKELEKNEEVDKEEKETSKEIRQLIKLKKFNRAIQLTEKYPHNPVIQSQRITIRMKQGKLKEAKEIGRREEFKNNAPIQSQMITIAMREGKLKEAKEIGRKRRV